jgi:hypothetical protein
MSKQFIGLTMLVTLNSPPGAQLRGVVSSIEPGMSLTLRHGKPLHRLPTNSLLTPRTSDLSCEREIRQ